MNFGGAKWLGATEDSEVLVCPAFPEGIPDRIAFGKDKHLEVAPDQTGDIIFEKAKE